MPEPEKQFASEEKPAKKLAGEFEPPQKSPETPVAKQATEEFEVQERLDSPKKPDPKSKSPSQRQ
jgi:hypothetical protein